MPLEILWMWCSRPLFCNRRCSAYFVQQNTLLYCVGGALTIGSGGSRLQYICCCCCCCCCCRNEIKLLLLKTVCCCCIRISCGKGIVCTTLGSICAVHFFGAFLLCCADTCCCGCSNDADKDSKWKCASYRWWCSPFCSASIRLM